jgi:Gas vesicle synthesis protein GvpO
LNIATIRDRTKKFLREALEAKELGEEIKIIGIDKAEDGWVAQAEVAERNVALPGHAVFEKKYYVVKLDSELEVVSFKQVKSIGEQEEE